MGHMAPTGWSIKSVAPHGRSKVPEVDKMDDWTGQMLAMCSINLPQSEKSRISLCKYWNRSRMRAMTHEEKILRQTLIGDDDARKIKMKVMGFHFLGFGS